MTEIRNCLFFPGGHAAYPQFSPEEDSAAGRMNEFYTALLDAARNAAASCGAGYVYSAEYTAEKTEDGFTIVYTLRLRRRGRTVSARTIIHRWKNGTLVMPQKKRLNPLSFLK